MTYYITTINNTQFINESYQKMLCNITDFMNNLRVFKYELIEPPYKTTTITLNNFDKTDTIEVDIFAKLTVNNKTYKVYSYNGVIGQ